MTASAQTFNWVKLALKVKVTPAIRINSFQLQALIKLKDPIVAMRKAKCLYMSTRKSMKTHILSILQIYRAVQRTPSVQMINRTKHAWDIQSCNGNPIHWHHRLPT